jgi:hypothetical protein
MTLNPAASSALPVQLSPRDRHTILENVCAVKAGAFQWEVDPPGNWFVPPGNNRSGGGGNKAVGAFDVKGRLSGSVSM